MKKVAILTINDDNNYGNRLQNYAVKKLLEDYNLEVETILNKKGMYNGNHFFIFKNKMKKFIKKFSLLNKHKRFCNFERFEKNIKYSSISIDSEHITKDLNNKYDFFITGSDQVWNPNFKRLSNVDLLEFVEPRKRIAFSASFGVSNLPEIYYEKAKRELLNFKAISVREDAGKNIVEFLTARKDVEVLLDPTMMLSSEEWDKVSKRPKMLKTDKFILNYFLGTLSDDRNKEIYRVARENNCQVINILDKKDPFYACGPSEFLYLEKHAFLICTDSFHSSVFAVIYNRPFIIFDREEEGMISMNSRIDTLISKLKLENRRYNNKSITKENLCHEYTESFELLKKEKEKVNKFLNNALNLR